jgi:hypothetical protein
MGKPLRHWWGAGLPRAFERPWSADESKRCEGEVQKLYVRKTLDGKVRLGASSAAPVAVGAGGAAVDGCGRSMRLAPHSGQAVLGLPRRVRTARSIAASS